MISRKQTVCSIKNMLQNFRGKDKEIAAEISKKKYKKMLRCPSYLNL